MSHDVVPTDTTHRLPVVPNPVDDPGVEPHVPRYTDTSVAAGNRAYRRILAMLGAVPVLAIAFVVVYFAVH